MNYAPRRTYLEDAAMLLAIEKLSKSYGAKPALRELDFCLAPGVYGLIGPNGAGKTTLMNIIAGNLRPSTGQVLYNGLEVASLGRKFRKILGYMPQQQALYPDFTGERFLYYIAALRGLDKREAAGRIGWAVEQVDLAEHIRKRIGASAHCRPPMGASRKWAYRRRRSHPSE